MEFTVTDDWSKTYPGAAVGLLAMRAVSNRVDDSALGQRAHALEVELRRRYAGWDRAALRASPIMAAYHAYYRRFSKTYHVMLQLESVVFKGLPIGGGEPLVRAMLMAELDTLLLTAGHDQRALRWPIGIDVATGQERYASIGGREQVLKAGDMYIADQAGILSSIVYGPDARSRIVADTREVLYTVYAPPGIGSEQVRVHLANLESLIRVASPEASTEAMRIEAAA